MTPDDFGRKFLVEDCQRIEVISLLRKYRHDFKRIALDSEIEAAGTKIEFELSKTGFGGERVWFKCPLCRARVGVLFKHPLSLVLGCRKCLNLDYRKRRYKGMVEGSIP
jgi:hypothetical protein